jgi:hypothetical protein
MLFKLDIFEFELEHVYNLVYIICKKNILKYFEAFTFVFILEVYKKKISISKDEIVFFS